MKTIPVLLVLPLLSPAVALHAHEGCTCGSSLVASLEVASADTAKRHPLKGTVVEVLAERSALLVKHEEIPGVMAAMTMLLRVDEAALKAVKKGTAVTGMLVRKADGWWLEDVKAAASSAGDAQAGS